MKALAATLLLLALAAAPVLGSLVMQHEGGHDICAAVAAQGVLCPEGGMFDTLSFHAGALRAFSTGLPFAALILAFACIAAAMRSLAQAAPGPGDYISHLVFRLAPSRLVSHHEFFRWLALRERRYPSAA